MKLFVAEELTGEGFLDGENFVMGISYVSGKFFFGGNFLKGKFPRGNFLEGVS